MKKLVDAIERIVDPPEDVTIGAEADSYLIQANTQSGMLRVVLFDIAGAAIGHFECDATEGYELASRILRGYDKLEGIK